jgi:GWxTD domain-containing protein
MRIVSSLLLITLLAACSTGKQTPQTRRRESQERVNAAYDARTEAQRNAPQRGSVPPTGNQPNPPTGAPSQVRTAAPVQAVDNATLPVRTASDWAVTSIKSKFLAIDSTNARVYMDMTFQSPAGTSVISTTDFSQHFQVAYIMYPDYNNRDRLGYGNVTLNEQSVLRQGDHLRLIFDVKRPKDLSTVVLLTEVTEIGSGTKARNDLTIRFGNSQLSDRYSLFDRDGQQPKLRHYVSVGDTVVIGDASNSRKQLYGIRYKHDFEAASSPMNTGARPVSRSLVMDSTLTITTNQPFVLPAEGLYYFVEDTTAASGIGLVVTDKRFPKLTRPEKLIKPVLYMSTSSEINELSQAQDTKKAFDRYWLGLMAGNQDVAKNTLRAYFNRVEEANRLFTTYKEGWKTDKGMIYIILGAPDRVQRNREREVWVYNRRANASEVNFTFTRKQNQFVEDHYELVRYMEYQPVWYPIVEAWRTGAIRE